MVSSLRSSSGDPSPTAVSRGDVTAHSPNRVTDFRGPCAGLPATRPGPSLAMRARPPVQLAAVAVRCNRVSVFAALVARLSVLTEAPKRGSTPRYTVPERPSPGRAKPQPPGPSVPSTGVGLSTYHSQRTHRILIYDRWPTIQLRGTGQHHSRFTSPSYREEDRCVSRRRRVSRSSGD